MVTNVATAPVPCTAGYFTSSAGQSVCTATQAGYYSNGTQPMQTVWLHLQMLKFHVQSVHTNQQLLKHHVLMLMLVTILLVLLQVTALIPASTALHTSQTPCASGYYQSATAQDECLEVQKGNYSLGTAGGLNVQTTVTSVATAPIPCPAGYYQGSDGQSSCDATVAGYYSNGTITDQTGSTEAAVSQVPCPAGTYQSATAQGSCDFADAGYFSEGSAGGHGVSNAVTGLATSQTPCDSGYYKASTGQIACIEVTAGNYSLGTTTANGVVQMLQVLQYHVQQELTKHQQDNLIVLMHRQVISLQVQQPMQTE